MMSYRSIACWGPLAAVLAVVSSSDAQAAGEPCFRDTECTGAALCLDGACGEADPGLAACTSDATCDGVCDDGFCKNEGIVCRNPAGACWVEADSGECACGNGDGAGWSDGFNPDDPPVMKTDAEIQAGCAVTLVDTCGSEVPSLPDSCQGAVLTECEAFVAKSDQYAMLCGENVPAANIARIGECCDSFDDPAYADLRACVDAVEIDTCPEPELEACGDGDGQPVGENDNASGGEATADADQSKSACRVGGGGSPWALFMLSCLGLAFRRRHA